jgi:hypothetical protein
MAVRGRPLAQVGEVILKGRRVLHDGHTVTIGDTTLRISILPADVRG